MTNPSLVQPALLSRINERQVLHVIRSHGPLSRAEVARMAGITAPTASKAVESLLRAGFLEEAGATAKRGRPAMKLRMATETAQVLGLVIDAEFCRLVASGLDGKMREQEGWEFPTPATYSELIDVAAEKARQAMARRRTNTLGLGISIPGLVDYGHNRGILSPNVPVTNGQSPNLDLAERLGVEAVMAQEEHALCIAERQFGAARGLDDFAMLDVSTGVGLGVMSGGRLLTGNSGLAGEIGHITLDVDGRQCGCGNRGCLETVASDSAFAWMVSQRVGSRLSVDEVLKRVQRGEIDPSAELARVRTYLAIGLAAVINLFNPSTLFVHGRLFEADPGFFASVVAETERRALRPSFADCEIVQARGSKRQGAIATVIEHLVDSFVPAEVTAPLVSSLAAATPDGVS